MTELDLNAIGAQIKKEAYSKGYFDGFHAAIETLKKASAHALSSSFPAVGPSKPSAQPVASKNEKKGRKGIREGSLVWVVLTIIQRSPGIESSQIKDAIKMGGDEKHAQNPDLSKRVDTAVTRLKDLKKIEKRMGKWYPIGNIK